MTTATMTKLIEAIITIVVILITSYVIPYLQQKIGAEKLAKLGEYTELAVRCAEQIYTDGANKKKKSYVQNYITEKAERMGLGLDELDIDNLIEGIVNEVKKG